MAFVIFAEFEQDLVIVMVSSMVLLGRSPALLAVPRRLEFQSPQKNPSQ
jgi:hypothetical protein